MQIRNSARVVLISPVSRVLLIRMGEHVPFDPEKPDLLEYWVTPGGGLDDGESFVEAARRELWEEAGYSDVEIGPWVWTRERVLIFDGQRTLSHERYFVAHVPDEQIAPAALSEDERRMILGYRWWSAEEIRDSEDYFIPEGLAGLIEPLVTGEVPARPVTVG